jgi:hypothetical protein
MVYKFDPKWFDGTLFQFDDGTDQILLHARLSARDPTQTCAPQDCDAERVPINKDYSARSSAKDRPTKLRISGRRSGERLVRLAQPVICSNCRASR